jgi:hypothetical protein
MSKEREQMNLVLGKSGWKLGNITKHGPIHIKYEIIRIADGHTAHIMQDIPELLLEDIRSDDVMETLREVGMEFNPFLAIRLILVAKSENRKNPPT